MKCMLLMRVVAVNSINLIRWQMNLMRSQRSNETRIAARTELDMTDGLVLGHVGFLQ